ncbi:single-stranded-DNA-specific exonuclease RecJ [Dokdonella sp.]|uniref:single-stranded-DNA-specific exonuclease RecJ n=1 Tax=Dokdonella sp. TaxID=2291710 RepID=UPI003784CE9C
MKAVAIRRREATTSADWPLELHPLVARVYAARGMATDEARPLRLADLLAPALLGGVPEACELLAEAIARDSRICIVGDFDADGATGTAVAVRGLRLLGARNVCYRVPNRMVDGYGLGVGLVESLADIRPDLVVTVDNGIASHAGVAAARARGMRVIVTDHHLPGPTLPPADAIVNPLLVRASSAQEAQSGHPCPHSSTSAQGQLGHLAGVGVMFYLLLALRARLFPDAASARPDLASLLDLVALGTVADLVPLDANNRILVAAGLQRIRSDRASAGIAALYRASGRDPRRAVAADLGYALGPRINAAGRLEDMSLGIECLLSDDAGAADVLAERLSAINAERRELQAAMVEQGEALLARFVERYREDALPCGVVLHEPDWHPGVVGLVASKLKERLNRPVVAFACADEGGVELRGSARSIAGFHLRDALAEVDAAHPGLIGRFGGHAMAAGLSLPAANLAAFAAEFDAVARRRLDPAQLERSLWSDGELAPHEITADNARALRYAAPWGQAFPEPAFDNVFAVESWRAVGEKHLRMQLRHELGGDALEAILFDAVEVMPPPARVRALFQLDLNDWNGRERLQLLVRHIEPA